MHSRELRGFLGLGFGLVRLFYLSYCAKCFNYKSTRLNRELKIQVGESIEDRGLR